MRWCGGPPPPPPPPPPQKQKLARLPPHHRDLFTALVNPAPPPPPQPPATGYLLKVGDGNCRHRPYVSICLMHIGFVCSGILHPVDLRVVTITWKSLFASISIYGFAENPWRVASVAFKTWIKTDICGCGGCCKDWSEHCVWLIAFVLFCENERIGRRWLRSRR